MAGNRRGGGARTGRGGRSGGPRQPLAQRRPKVAASRSAAARGRAAASSAGGKAPATGAKRGGTPRARGARAGRATPELAREFYRRLEELYPNAHCELDFASPFQLLIATILSAQTTDRRVNMVTPVLFARYPSADALAAARTEDVEEIIRSTGFFRSKAKSIIGMANALVDRFGGRVPRTMAELVTLPGVGRKTANVILGNAFGVNEGVVVDTHVTRLSARLGLSRETEPTKIEQDLMALYPSDQWTMLSHLLIWHGRRVCDARKPRHDDCVLRDICPSARII
jgi:endonuclease-3